MGCVLACRSFGFLWPARRREINDVEPGENARKYRPQNRTIPLPGTDHSYR
jgi:hypothetical protein